MASITCLDLTECQHLKPRHELAHGPDAGR
jgi:hypothetical protein